MSAFVLKLVAIITMLIDHFGAGFSFMFDTSLMRIIGRIAFPIFAFFIAEGCKYTKSKERYLARLFAFGLISEIPFDLFINQANIGDYLRLLPFSLIRYQNVFFTMFLGVLAVYVYEKFKPTEEKGSVVTQIAAVLAVFVVAFFFKSDYGLFGVMIIFATYIAGERRKQIAVLGLGVVGLYGSNLILLAVALVSVLLIYLYNGKRGPSLKWLFYAFYPAHISLIVLILYGINNNWF